MHCGCRERKAGSSSHKGGASRYTSVSIAILRLAKVLLHPRLFSPMSAWSLTCICPKNPSNIPSPHPCLPIRLSSRTSMFICVLERGSPLNNSIIDEPSHFPSAYAIRSRPASEDERGVLREIETPRSRAGIHSFAVEGTPRRYSQLNRSQ
jgi:hypothetical protein